MRRVWVRVKVSARARVRVGVKGARGALRALVALCLGAQFDSVAVGATLAGQLRATAFGAVLASRASHALGFLGLVLVLAGLAREALGHARIGRVAAGRARLGLGRARIAREASHALVALFLGADFAPVAVGATLAGQLRATALGAELARPAQRAVGFLGLILVLAGIARRALGHARIGRVAAGRARLGLGRARCAREASRAIAAFLGGGEVGGVAVGAGGAERRLSGARLAEFTRLAR